MNSERKRRLEAYLKLRPLAQSEIGAAKDNAAVTAAMKRLCGEIAATKEKINVQIEITNSGAAPIIISSSGDVLAVGSAAHELEIRTSANTYNEIIAGNLSPLAAFYMGKLEFAGDLFAAKRLLVKLSSKNITEADLNL